MPAYGRPPETMNGCFEDAQCEGSGFVVRPLRSELTGSYGSASPVGGRQVQGSAPQGRLFGDEVGKRSGMSRPISDIHGLEFVAQKPPVRPKQDT
jgi:hypothetical protein